MKNIALVDVIIMQTELALSWNDKEESYMSFQLLRDNCPCAFCSGEKDVFGNIYKGPKKKLQENAYQVKKIERVGHYAIRIFWGDNHVDGLFTYEMLRNLGNS